MSYTGGSLLRKGIKALVDGPTVKIIKDAGAIPLLVSNTSEFCTSLHSYNFLYGHTLNPYDRRRTPGGSSGGEVSINYLHFHINFNFFFYIIKNHKLC